MLTFRSIWKFRRSFRNLRHQMIFSLLDWRRLYRSTSSLIILFRSLLSRKEKLDLLSARIQKDLAGNWNLLYHRPQQCQSPSCLALDNEAKHCRNMRSNWSYEDVESSLETAPAHWFLGHWTSYWKTIAKIGITSICWTGPGSPRSLKERIRSHGPSTVVPCSWHWWKQCPQALSSEITRHWQLSNLALWLPSTNRHWTGISGDGWTGGYSLATEKKKTQLVSIHASYSKKSRGFRPFTASKDWAYPIHQGFIRYGSAALSLQVRRRRHSADWCFFMENLSRSLFNSFLSSMTSSLGKRGETPADHWPHSGSIWLYLFRKAPHY